MNPPLPAAYERGVRTIFSRMPAKDPFWSQIKSCNYLQNVLMKKECLDKGADFAICLDDKGRLCEGSTENMMIITKDARLIVPRFDYTLHGTTIQIVMKLAEGLVSQGLIKSVSFGDLLREDLLSAAEAAFVGTTLGVLPMSEIEGATIGKGVGGEISLMLNQALTDQMTTNRKLRTEF